MMKTYKVFPVDDGVYCACYEDDYENIPNVPFAYGGTAAGALTSFIVSQAVKEVTGREIEGCL